MHQPAVDDVQSDALTGAGLLCLQMKLFDQFNGPLAGGKCSMDCRSRVRPRNTGSLIWIKGAVPGPALDLAESG